MCLLTIYIVSKRSPGRILQAALDRFFLEAVPKLLQGTFFFWGGFLSDGLISKKQRPFQFKHGGNYVVDIVHVCYIFFCLFTQFFLYSYLNNFSSIILKL